MKKFTALFLLITFLNASGAFAIEEAVSEKIQAAAEKTAAGFDIEKKVEKKDPGIIKLPNKQEIDKKAFAEKIAADEKEYRKIKALAGSGYLFIRDDEGKIKTKFTEGSLTEEEKEFKDTRESWIDGYYLLYKTADRLLRANNLDTQNWRFLIEKKTKEVNAYASSANLVTINSSLADTFYDNEDALAAVIGHELSHHIFNHMQKSLEAKERIARLNSRIENALLGGIYTAGLTIIIFVPIFQYRKSVWYKRMRQQEIQADIEALTLMARAGYNTEGANDIFAVFSKLPELKFHYMEESHPKTKDRIAAVNRQLALLNTEALRIEGEKNLYEKPVMKMKRSSDKDSIVLISHKNTGSINYQALTEQQNVIYKAYEAYLKDDNAQAEKLFNEAYSLDKKNYIPCLYLSYIHEYNYKKNSSMEELKQAKIWAVRAYKKKSADKNTIKQKLDIEALYKSSK